MKSFLIYGEQSYPSLDVTEKFCTRVNSHLCDEIWIATHPESSSELHKSSRKFSLSYNGSPFFSRKTNIPESSEAKPTDLSFWPWLPIHWGGHQEPCWQATWFWIRQFWEFHTGQSVKAKSCVFGGRVGRWGVGILPVYPSGTFKAQGGGLHHPRMTALWGSTFSPLPSHRGHHLWSQAGKGKN